MTPQDFLDSVVEQEPRRKYSQLTIYRAITIIIIFSSLARLKRRILTEQEVLKIKDQTPPLKKGSNQLFRTLRDKGK